MLSSLSNQSFKDTFESVDSIRVNYSLAIQTCSKNQELSSSQHISSLQVQPFIEFKNSGELRLFFKVFDENNLVSPVIIDSTIAVSHSQELSIHSEDRDALDAPIEEYSTPVLQELEEDLNQQTIKSLMLTQQSLLNLHSSYDAQTLLPSNGEQQFIQNSEPHCFNSHSFYPYKQKKLGNDLEQLKEELAVSTASQEHSLDNQFLFNISPGKEGSKMFNESLPPIILPLRIKYIKDPEHQQEFKTFKETQKQDCSQRSNTKVTTTSNRKRGQYTDRNELNQIEQNTLDLNGFTKKKAAKIEEKKDENACNNSKGNAVNMAKNILKGFMEYVFISAKEQDIISSCSKINEISKVGVTLPLRQLSQQPEDNQDIEEDDDCEEQENDPNNLAEELERDIQQCPTGNRHNQNQKSTADSIRRRFRKQYNQKLLEKPSNSKLLKLFANTNYGLLFQHYFESDEIMSYIESSNIQNKLAHKDLVEKIRATAFDIDKLQDVLKTRIFKRPPFQKPQK